jgi:hypothetical protein
VGENFGGVGKWRGVLVSSRLRLEISWAGVIQQHNFFNSIDKTPIPNTLKTMSDSATPVGLAVPTRKPVPAPAAEEAKDKTHTPSQRYLSTRGGSYGVSAPQLLPIC